MIHRRHALALGLTALAMPALAQESRPLRLVVAFPAGGPTDVVARILAERMGRALGQPLVVENRGGANGNIAAEVVAKAEPDGSTLLYNTSSIAISRALYRQLSYDVLADLAPVALTAAALTDTAAGNVQFTSDTVVTALPMIQGGQVRAIAVSSVQRTPLLPEVPSMAESGLTPPGFDLGAWQGVMAPARTPPAAIARVNAAVNTALADADVRARLAAQGARPTGGSVEEYRRTLASEITLWTRVVRESGASAD